MYYYLMHTWTRRWVEKKLQSGWKEFNERGSTNHSFLKTYTLIHSAIKCDRISVWMTLIVYRTTTQKTAIKAAAQSMSRKHTDICLPIRRRPTADKEPGSCLRRNIMNVAQANFLVTEMRWNIEYWIDNIQPVLQANIANKINRRVELGFCVDIERISIQSSTIRMCITNHLLLRVATRKSYG